MKIIYDPKDIKKIFGLCGKSMSKIYELKANGDNNKEKKKGKKKGRCEK